MTKFVRAKKKLGGSKMMTKVVKERLKRSKFIQISACKGKFQSDVFALDALGNIWRYITNANDSNLQDIGHWELLSNRRVISQMIEDVFVDDLPKVEVRY